MSRLVQADRKTKRHVETRWHRLMRSIQRNWELYLMSVPVVLFFLVFAYWPMYGVQIAFRDYSIPRGITSSPWVGLKHLNVFVNSFYFWRTIRNTLAISIYSLIIGLPAPIILAIVFQEVRSSKRRSVLQAVSYAPNFMSTVVVCGMIVSFLSPQTGVVPAALRLLGIDIKTSLLSDPNAFWHIYVWTGVWQGIGWSSLIYTASISGISVDQYEAATIDGASRLRQIFSITIPNIAPTIIILLILSLGNVMSVGYEKVFLLQNSLNLETSEVISTYVYKTGLTGKPRYSFSAMVGLFNSVINLILLSAVNMIARRTSETSLW